MTELYIIEAKGVEHEWTGAVHYLTDIAPTILRTCGESGASAVVSHWQRGKQNTRLSELIYSAGWYGGELCGWRMVERFEWPVHG